LRWTWRGRVRRFFDRALLPDPFAKHFDAIAVIHLDRATQRRARFEQTFRETGIRTYRVLPAVDGSTLDLDGMRERGELLPSGGRDLSPGEVGCVLSHRMAWQLMLDEGIGRMLICEDDIQFRIGARWWLRKHMAAMPAGWDIIHFYSSFDIGSDTRSGRGREHIQDGVYRGYWEGGTTTCYAVSRAAARYLLDRSTVIAAPADGITNWVTGDAPGGGQDLGLRGYVVSPFICRPWNRDSLVTGRPAQRRP
jgi:glycosyl transferase family 25